MAAKRPTIDDLVTDRAGGLGKANTTNLNSIFGGTPGKTLVDTAYKTTALKLLKLGSYKEFPSDAVTTVSEIAGGGQTDWSSFSRDYTGGPASGLRSDQAPPDYGNVKTGDAGKPASAWVPNPVSPGQGNGVDPSRKAAAPAGYGTTATNTLSDSVGGGAANSSKRNPSTSSSNMATEPTALVAGQSPATSNSLPPL
jgi:hypothetical protein